MDAGKRARMIEQYEQGYAAVEEALAGASESELDARPAPELFPPSRLWARVAPGN